MRIERDDVEAALPTAAREIEEQYLQPRWARLSERQREYVTAIAVAGGEASARQLQVLLDRSGSALSRVREELIRRGEIYRPRSRTMAVTMPLVERYAIAAYPEDRAQSSLGEQLAALEQLERNQASWQARSATRPGVAGARISPDPTTGRAWSRHQDEGAADGPDGGNEQSDSAG